MTTDNGENDVLDLVAQTERISAEIRSMHEVAVFITLINDEKMLREVEAVGCILTVIMQAVQIGNVRRAYKYLAALKKIWQNMNEAAERVRGEVNNRIL